MSTASVLREVRNERRRQDAKFPDQRLRLSDIPQRVNLTHEYEMLLESARLENDHHSRLNSATWESVMREEWCEAVLEPDLDKAREEWLQVAAVAVRVVENIDAAALLKGDV